MKPVLEKLTQDQDVDVKYFAQEALTGMGWGWDRAAGSAPGGLPAVGSRVLLGPARLIQPCGARWGGGC